MGDSKPETQPPALMQLDSSTTSSSISASMTSGITAPPFNIPPPGPGPSHVTGNIAQDFKRMVHERNTPGSVVNAQGGTVTTTVAQKPPPPNAIITDPNNKVGGGGVSSTIGVSELTSSSKMRFDVQSSPQQSRSLLGNQPQPSATSAVPTVSEADQKKRDEFRQKVLQSVNQPASTATAPIHVGEGKTTAQEAVVEVKNGGQEASIAGQKNVGENQKGGLLPLPVTIQPLVPSAPLNVSPDEPSVKQVGESENIVAPSEDKSETLPSVPITQATVATNGSEQVDVPSSSEVQTDVHVPQVPVPVQPVQSVQPEKAAENDEETSKEVAAEDVSPPPPVPAPTPAAAVVPPSSDESTMPPEKIEDVPEKSSEEDSAQSIQVNDTEDSQVTAVDSEAPPPSPPPAATTVVTDDDTCKQEVVESEAVKPKSEEDSSQEKLKVEKVEEKVESSQPPSPPPPPTTTTATTATEETPVAEPPKPKPVKQEEEEKPSLSKSEPEEKEKEPVKKKAEAAVPSSAVLVSESPKLKDEAPTTTTTSTTTATTAAVKELPGDVDDEDVKRTEKFTAGSVESGEAKVPVEELKAAVADQKQGVAASSRESVAKDKVNGEPKEPSQPPKQDKQDERSDTTTVPASKPVKQEKPVDEGKSSPHTKPKEAVKQDKPDKQDRPASSKPVAAVPASAQLAPGEHLLE